MVILLKSTFRFINPERELSCRSFAVGLGPIPFVMIPEVSPANVSPIDPTKLTVRTHFMIQAVSSLSSIALSLNCRRCIPLTQERNSMADILNQQGL